MMAFGDHAGKPRERGIKDRDLTGLGACMGRHAALHRSLRNLSRKPHSTAMLWHAVIFCIAVGWISMFLCGAIVAYDPSRGFLARRGGPAG